MQPQGRVLDRRRDQAECGKQRRANQGFPGYDVGDARTKRHWLFFSSKPTPGPGSEVFVPTKPPGEGVNTVALMGAIASILTSLVAIVAVAKSL